MSMNAGHGVNPKCEVIFQMTEQTEENIRSGSSLWTR